MYERTQFVLGKNSLFLLVYKEKKRDGVDISVALDNCFVENLGILQSVGGIPGLVSSELILYIKFLIGVQCAKENKSCAKPFLENS